MEDATQQPLKCDDTNLYNKYIVAMTKLPHNTPQDK